jgi:MFS family permease
MTIPSQHQHNSPSTKTHKPLWRSIYWVSFPFGIITFVLPIYGKDLGASALEIGGFFSAASIVPVLIRPFLGPSLDRWGRRPFLLLGLLSHVFAMIVFSLADTVVLLTVARLIQGMGTAFLWLTAFTIVADIALETGRGHDFGFVDEAANRGAIVGSISGFLLIGAFTAIGISWGTTWFVLFGVFSLLAGVGFWVGYKGVPETKPTSSPEAVDRRPISKQLIYLMIIIFLTGASSAMVWPLLMVFLQDTIGAEIWGLALAYLPAAILGAFLPSRLGKIADTFGRKLPMVIGLIVGAIASVLIPSLRSIFGLTILWTIESIAWMTAMPAERAFVADIAGRDVRGTNYGLYTFAYFLGAVFGPLAGGWLYDTVGNSSPFYLNAVVLVIGALLVAGLLSETRPKSAIEAG